MFDHCHSIIYVADVSSYCKIDPITQKNNLQNEIDFFSFFMKNKWNDNNNILVFLNKEDAFQDKLTNFPLSDYYPSYKGIHQ